MACSVTPMFTVLLGYSPRNAEGFNAVANFFSAIDQGDGPGARTNGGNVQSGIM